MNERPRHTTPMPAEAATREVPLRPIVMFAIVLVVLSGLTLGGMSWLFTALTTRQAALDPPPVPLARTLTQLPPEPRLQVVPPQDLKQLRAAEEALLHGYGWVDAGAEVVRIPIARAMELVVRRGLPARTAPEGGRRGEEREPAVASP